MHISLKLIFVYVLMVISPFAFSEEKIVESTNYGNSWVGYIAIEGMIIANSALAAGNPKAYGTFLAVISPFASDLGDGLSRSNSQNIAMLIGMESVAFYNIIEMDKNKYSDIEIFRRNFIGWNIVGAAFLATSYLSKENKKRKKYSYIFAPMNDGGYAQISYKFE